LVQSAVSRRQPNIALHQPAAEWLGAGAGAVISTWNLVGMYTTIPVATWDLVRQVLFLFALASIAAVAARAARAGGSWGVTGGLATVAAVTCAATVLATYALSTSLATDRIRQVPEFIRDYTNNGYTSPATYFADRYWALLELQAFTWGIGAAGLAAVGTILGRAAAIIGRRRAA
jgi:hypothetical protein